MSSGLPSSITCDPPILEIPTDPPTWLWAYTCRNRGCDCRDVVILATTDGREALLERVHRVYQLRGAEGKFLDAAWQVRELDTFYFHLDTAQPYWSNANQQDFDLTDHPRIGPLAARLDGERLETIDRWWHRGKGQPDPQEHFSRGDVAMPTGWTPGELVGWHELCPAQRRDLYLFKSQAYEAMEMYCPTPGCACGVTLRFEAVSTGDSPDPGHLVIPVSGSAASHPAARQNKRLEELWGAFRRRHPRYAERFARRNGLVKTACGKYVVAAPRPATTKAKVGRNEPCPCGSNKKFKKCCGTATGG